MEDKNEKKDSKLLKRSFKLLEYLRKNTDREHPVIQAKLREAEEIKEYLGTKATFNKTVSRLAEVLNSDEHGRIRHEEEWVLVYQSFSELYGEGGGDRDKKSKSSSIKNIYFNHIFSNDEMTAIINALRTSKAVDRSCAEHVIKKLTGLASKFYKEPVYKLHMPEFTDSPQLAENLSMIQKAIGEGKKIAFVFNFYNSKGVLVPTGKDLTIVNPHYIVSDHGRLYLIGGFEDDRMCVYRIDLMTNVQIWQKNKHSEPSTMKHTIDGLPLEMNDEFKVQRLYMSYQKPITVKFRNTKTSHGCKPNYTFIHDVFGDNFKVVDSKENIVRARCSEFGILSFALQFGEYIEILEPAWLREKVAERIWQLGKKYSLIQEENNETVCN